MTRPVGGIIIDILAGVSLGAAVIAILCLVVMFIIIVRAALAAAIAVVRGDDDSADEDARFWFGDRHGPASTGAEPPADSGKARKSAVRCSAAQSGDDHHG